jgi:cytochrome c oxidase subunit 1
MTTMQRTVTGTEVAEPTRELGTKVWKWMTTTDHKVIGNMYLVTSFAFFIFGGILALMIRAELAQPGTQFFDDEARAVVPTSGPPRTSQPRRSRPPTR